MSFKSFVLVVLVLAAAALAQARERERGERAEFQVWQPAKSQKNLILSKYTRDRANDGTTRGETSL